MAISINRTGVRLQPSRIIASSQQRGQFSNLVSQRQSASRPAANEASLRTQTVSPASAGAPTYNQVSLPAAQSGPWAQLQNQWYSTFSAKPVEEWTPAEQRAFEQVRRSDSIYNNSTGQWSASYIAARDAKVAAATAYDQARHESAMIRFMEANNVKNMSPEEYFHYLGSPQEAADNASNPYVQQATQLAAQIFSQSPPPAGTPQGTADPAPQITTPAGSSPGQG